MEISENKIIRVNIIRLFVIHTIIDILIKNPVKGGSLAILIKFREIIRFTG